MEVAVKSGILIAVVACVSCGDITGSTSGVAGTWSISRIAIEEPFHVDPGGALIGGEGDRLTLGTLQLKFSGAQVTGSMTGARRCNTFNGFESSCYTLPQTQIVRGTHAGNEATFDIEIDVCNGCPVWPWHLRMIASGDSATGDVTAGSDGIRRSASYSGHLLMFRK